jgi:hypothetical protein
VNARNDVAQATYVGQIQNGWWAYDAKGEHMGEAVKVGGTHIQVQKGLFFPKDLYIPFSSVASVDAANANFFVDATKDDVASLGWDTPPAEAGWPADEMDR